ncbi:SusC/RagA family TonB-linked outer membrane protein [Maribellus sediminis]|uniref:SusC/RagA family TonB-linked outer membrane protein n=1 Tax=Maribellus sediminis TaxID=2696285 RepID=UPI001430E267|nr:SusC/RagA family TonB-linked outer membrane protein [Maribellus sediminis]
MSKNRTNQITKQISGTIPQRVIVLIAFIVQLFAVSVAFGQNQIMVSGKVTDNNGEPMVGVNIIVKNTLKGTVSDIDGNYTLSVASTDTLQVSFIGFVQQFVPVKGRTSIDIALEEATTDLDEVVVVGYGEVKRANLLGSISSISADEIEDIPAVSMTNLLEGRMAGVSVSPAQPTGNPGASTRVTIRTETTFGNSGEGAKDPSPLYIVDGFEVSQEEFDILDPSEIESYSVLKDASASVYGSKGANGVILVKTKRGKEGKLRVSYSGSVGVSDATTQTEMLSAYDHARMINARYRDDTTALISSAEMADMKNQNFQWLDEAWQKSMVTRHTVNISGGSKAVKYFAGGTYMYTEGNFPEMGVGKFSYRLGIDANITDQLKASATISIDSRDFKRPYISGVGSNTLEDLFQQLLQAPKWTPAYIDGYPVSNNLDFNPLYLFETNSYKQSVDKGHTLNLNLSYDFERVKGLRASVRYSRREGHSYAKDYLVPYTLYQFKPLGNGYKYILSNEIEEVVTIQNNNRISETYGYNENYQLNASLNYTRTFGKHDVAAFFTYEQSEGRSNDFRAVGENIEVFGLENQNAFQTKTTSGGMYESGDIGAVFRLNYSYANKYLFESATRYETTTKFAPGEREGIFPSGSVGWVISEENFMKDNVSAINFMKLRFSIGLTGYASVSPYEYELQYALKTSNDRYLFGGDSPVGGIGIGGKTDVVSSGVSWEKSLMHNLGLDMKFFNNKLGLSFDAYYTYQYDILDKRTVEFPETAGLGVMPGENLGRLEAWGYDMSINYHGRITDDIYFDITGIFNYGTNRIIERPTEYIPDDFRYPIGQSTMAAGREEGFISNGIIRTQEQLDALNAQWQQLWGHDYMIEGRPVSLGALIFEDIGRPGNTGAGEPRTVFEPDGVINEYDKKYVERVGDELSWKHMLPTSINIGGGWKDLKITTLWTMEYGIRNQAVDKLARTVPTTSENSPAFWSDFWTPETPNAAYPSPYYASSDQWVSTFWMKDVYQLRLRTLNISYSIPKELSKKWGVPELRVYFVGTNLWSPIQTFDYKEDAIARYNTYPLLKTFSFGLSFKI